MARYVGARLIQALPVLFLVSVVVFLFVRLVPGDPAVTMAGPDARPEQVAALRERFGLEGPLAAQYLIWVGHVAQGDFGTAYRNGQPVLELILQRLPATLHLAAGAMLVTLLLGGPLGIFAAVRPRHPLSRVAATLTAVGLAIPTFWLGILLVLLVGVRLRWLPPSGYVSITENPLDSIRLLILPSLTLGIPLTAVLIRFLVASVSEVMRQDFMRTAYAKGLRERAVVIGHALKNALPPVITVLAIEFGYLLGGAVITEQIFGWPGLGRLIIDAVGTREYLVIQGTILLFVTTFIVVNIVADVSYAFLNPRIRYE